MSLGKHLFGGLGHNPFNPAMLAYVVLLVSFPQAMTHWPAPAQPAMATDVLSGATVLDQWRNALRAEVIWSEFAESAAAQGSLRYGASHLNTLANLGWIAGGFLLFSARIAHWQTAAATVLGILTPALLAHGLFPDRFAPASMQILSGATLFAAVFIVTDPVSGATTPRGRWLFGVGVGLLSWLVRTVGQYPDGFAFAVLLMNLCVPWLDRLQPRVIGHHSPAASARGPAE